MPKFFVTDLAGETHEMEGQVGDTVMETIKAAGLDDLLAICGGCCACATCHVYVEEAWLERLPEQEEDEYELVADTEFYKPNSRLSCQLEVTGDLDGLRLEIAPEE